MILKTKITTTEEKQIEIPVPCFFRNKEETIYIGLLDEKTVVEITRDSYESSIRNFNNDSWSAGLDRIRDAYLKLSACSESEFLEAIDKTIGSMPINQNYKIPLYANV